MNNKFFYKKNNIPLSKIFKTLKLDFIGKDRKIYDIKDLASANSHDISFMNSNKYFDLLKKTKAKYVITNTRYKNIVDRYCKPILVKNVLPSVANVTLLFYPKSLDDTFDNNVFTPDQRKYKNIKFGKNVLIGKNVKIRFVKDRPGHDIRYALNSNKIKKKLGWKPKINFSEGIKLTFEWYTKNKNWK